MPAYDYSLVADVYDTFCVFADDLDFFRSRVRGSRGPILELMSGTGRVSLPLVEEGADLVCCEWHLPMLSRLAGKLERRGLAATLVCGNACALPFDGVFEQVLLPFQGFCELVSEEEQRRALARVAAALLPGGRFVCTTHNPAVRSRTIDGAWHRFGEFPDERGGKLVLSLRTRFGERPDVVVGRERIERIDAGGRLREERVVDLTFSLVSADRLVHLARRAGLRLVELLGDYAGSPYDAASSPCVVAIFEKAGE